VRDLLDGYAVGPVEAFDDEHQRTGGGDLPEQRCHGVDDAGGIATGEFRAQHGPHGLRRNELGQDPPGFGGVDLGV
jgi:hypothetical protein